MRLCLMWGVEPPAALAVLGIGSVPSLYLINIGTGKDFYQMEEKKIFWEVKKAENRYLQRWMEIVDLTVKYLFEAPSPEQDEEVIEQREQALSNYRRELEEIASENSLTFSELAEKYNAKYLD